MLYEYFHSELWDGLKEVGILEFLREILKFYTLLRNIKFTRRIKKKPINKRNFVHLMKTLLKTPREYTI